MGMGTGMGMGIGMGMGMVVYDTVAHIATYGLK